MTTLTNKRTVILSVIALIAIVVSLGFYTSSSYSENVARGGLNARYVADFSDPRNILGAAHNVFVGKIVREVEQTSVQGIPVTLFEAEVVYNIKGDLKDSVTVLQPIGYFEDEQGNQRLSSLNGNEELMKPGGTYLLATRYDEEFPRRDVYTMNDHPNASKLLSTNATLSIAELKIIAKNDEKVQAWKEAYREEHLLNYDVLNNNTRNSHDALQGTE